MLHKMTLLTSKEIILHQKNGILHTSITLITVKYRIPRYFERTGAKLEFHYFIFNICLNLKKFVN